jgi:hypothetical protein
MLQQIVYGCKCPMRGTLRFDESFETEISEKKSIHQKSPRDLTVLIVEKLEEFIMKPSRSSHMLVTSSEYS